jgi:hypothetical protein
MRLGGFDAPRRDARRAAIHADQLQAPAAPKGLEESRIAPFQSRNRCAGFHFGLFEDAPPDMPAALA